MFAMNDRYCYLIGAVGASCCDHAFKTITVIGTLRKADVFNSDTS